MADKTMPPTESPTPQPEAMTGEMATPTTASGQVMVQMPADAFDSIHALVTQLAAGLDALKTDVDSQKGASVGEVAPAPAGGGSPEMSASDEEFLKSLAQEGSMR